MLIVLAQVAPLAPEPFRRPPAGRGGCRPFSQQRCLAETRRRGDQVSLRSIPSSRRSISLGRDTRPGRHLGMYSLVSSSAPTATVCRAESTIGESYAEDSHHAAEESCRLRWPRALRRIVGSSDCTQTLTPNKPKLLAVALSRAHQAASRARRSGPHDRRPRDRA